MPVGSNNKKMIVIAPKKKKKKAPPLIIIKKLGTNNNNNNNNTNTNTINNGMHTSAVSAIHSNSKSATATATATASATASATLATSNKKSNLITIKPYEKPPALPIDFYDVNIRALRRAATCVLRKQPLLADDNNNNNNNNNYNNDDDDDDENTTTHKKQPQQQQQQPQQQQRLIGREELYRSVEDLCVHKFGPKLYREVVIMLDEAAGEVVRRLVATSVGGAGAGLMMVDGETAGEAEAAAGVEGDDNAFFDPITKAVGYRASMLLSSLNLQEGGLGSSSKQQQQQQQQHQQQQQDAEDTISPSDKRYALLRRMHAICKVSYAEEYLTFVRSIFLALDRAYVYFAEEDLERIGVGGVGGADNNEEAPPKGKVMERSSSHGSNPRIWGLWEVGIACLRRHMMQCPGGNTGSATVSTNGTIIRSSKDEDTVLPVLVAMVKTTAYAILSEYGNLSSSSSSSTAGDAAAAMGDTRPLVRNCVRSCIDLAALSSLLEELIIAATARFEREGQWWGTALKLEEGRGGGGGGDVTKHTASEFLQHVENRLKQSSALTAYYLPSNAVAVAALRQLANANKKNKGSGDDKRAAAIWASSNNSNTRRMLSSIIEARLLSPHLVPTGILQSHHLYPMLDDDDGSGTGGAARWRNTSGGKTFGDAKRLYGLCWRLTASSPPSSSASSSSQSPISALEHLRIAFGEYGRLRGREIIKQGKADGSNSNSKEMEKKIIPDLLAFKSHLQSLHTLAFRSDESFGAMVRSVLEDVMNGDSSRNGNDGDGGKRIAELLAKHVDARFKDVKAQAAASHPPLNAAAAAGATSSALAAAATAATDPNEAFQTEIMALFRHVHSKDVFEAFYKRDLSKRLLTGRSVSYDVERSFLSKLKAECGTGYTSKMEGMFKDMGLSRDIMSSYSAYSAGATNATMGQNATGSLSLSSSGGAGKVVEMDVQVLTTGYWPMYPKYPNIILPPEIEAQKSKFESYYNNKYQGRRIAWQYSLGNCVVKASFPKQTVGKELIVNLCQTLVLLCFQYEDGPDGKGLTIGEVMKKTGIDDRDETERVLQSLSLGRDGTRVLTKVDHDPPSGDVPPSPTSVSGNEAAASSSSSPSKPGSPGKRILKKSKIRRNVGPNDRFLFNASFTSNQRRIRITNITMKETAEERTKTHETVSKDRLYLIDAAVVRIMKARKTIDHSGLMGEVMAQVKFPATSSDVKKRVESLIEREYMERVEGDRSRYNYLA